MIVRSLPYDISVLILKCISLKVLYVSIFPRFFISLIAFVFQKPFYVVGMGSLGGRSASLLAKLNLSDRILGEVTDFLDGKIDYERVEFLLENYRMESVDYLKFDEHND